MLIDPIIRIMPKKCSPHENHSPIEPSFGIGIGIDGEIDNGRNNSNYADDLRNNQITRRGSDDIIVPNTTRMDAAYPDRTSYPHPRTAKSEPENRNRNTFAEQGNNLMSMAQNVRNLGFASNMSMNNFNQQQVNSLNASFNAVGTINNMNYPRFRNSMFVPDISSSLSSASRFPNQHHSNFSPETALGPQNHDHSSFPGTDDNTAAMHRGNHNSDQYFGGQFGFMRGSLGDAATVLSGHTDSSSTNNNMEIRRENKRRENMGKRNSNIPIAKRMRYYDQSEHFSQEQQQPIPSISEKWAVPSGRSFPLYHERDERNLSQYQCLARKQMEIFEATSEDAGSNAQGRNRPILPGQIGLRCRHCYKLPPKERKTGSVYYPNKVSCMVIFVFTTIREWNICLSCRFLTRIIICISSVGRGLPDRTENDSRASLQTLPDDPK